MNTIFNTHLLHPYSLSIIDYRHKNYANCCFKYWDTGNVFRRKQVICILKLMIFPSGFWTTNVWNAKKKQKKYKKERFMIHLLLGMKKTVFNQPTYPVVIYLENVWNIGRQTRELCIGRGKKEDNVCWSLYSSLEFYGPGLKFETKVVTEIDFWNKV